MFQHISFIYQNDLFLASVNSHSKMTFWGWEPVGVYLHSNISISLFMSDFCCCCCCCCCFGVNHPIPPWIKLRCVSADSSIQGQSHLTARDGVWQVYPGHCSRAFSDASKSRSWGIAFGLMGCKTVLVSCQSITSSMDSTYLFNSSSEKLYDYTLFLMKL